MSNKFTETFDHLVDNCGWLSQWKPHSTRLCVYETARNTHRLSAMFQKQPSDANVNNMQGGYKPTTKPQMICCAVQSRPLLVLRPQHFFTSPSHAFLLSSCGVTVNFISVGRNPITHAICQIILLIFVTRCTQNHNHWWHDDVNLTWIWSRHDTEVECSRVEGDIRQLCAQTQTVFKLLSKYADSVWKRRQYVTS